MQENTLTRWRDWLWPVLIGLTLALLPVPPGTSLADQGWQEVQVEGISFKVPNEWQPYPQEFLDQLKQGLMRKWAQDKENSLIERKLLALLAFGDPADVNISMALFVGDWRMGDTAKKLSSAYGVKFALEPLLFEQWKLEAEKGKNILALKRKKIANFPSLEIKTGNGVTSKGVYIFPAAEGLIYAITFTSPSEVYKKTEAIIEKIQTSIKIKHPGGK